MNWNWLAQHRFQFLYFHHAYLSCSCRWKRTDPCSTMGYVVKGTARMTLDNTDYLVKPGTVLFIPQGAGYRLTAMEPFDFFWLRYRLWLSNGKQADRMINLPPAFTPDDFDECLNDLASMTQLNRPNAAARMRIEFLAHGLVLRHLTSDLMRDMPPNRMDPRAWRMRSLLLTGGIIGPYSGASLARHAGLSPAQMHRLFRRYFHDTPKGYWEKERLKIIQRELCANTMTMSDIADTYGFADSSHFTRWFKHLAGEPPSRYRKKHRRSFSFRA